MFVLHKIINSENEVYLHKCVENFYNTVGYCYAESVMRGWQSLLFLAELEKQAIVKGSTLVFLSVCLQQYKPIR